MEAFSASRFVCEAISLIVVIIFSISMDAWLISPIDSTISCIFWLLPIISCPSSSTLLLISSALSAFCDTCSDTEESVTVKSLVIAVCSAAPWASPAELPATCWESYDTRSATRWIPFTVSAMLCSNCIRESRMFLKSPFHSTDGRTSKLPFENSCIIFEISST